jgi:hypothetical protein
LVLETADAGGRAKRRLEGKNTGIYEQAKSTVQHLLRENITVTIVLLKDKQRFIRFRRGLRTVIRKLYSNSETV